jgi:hypothetical protein
MSNKDNTFMYVFAKMNKERFDYCFRYGGYFENVNDEEFHRLRQEYISAANALETYVQTRAQLENKNTEMNKAGGVFYFRFSFENDINDDDDDVVHNTWAFNFKPDAVNLDGLTIDDMQDDWYETTCEEIESDYGVHDWNSSPCDNITAVGYCTYEISQEDAPVCVERWRQEFVALLGAENVSTQIYDLGSVDVEDDLDAFNRVEELENVGVEE